MYITNDDEYHAALERVDTLMSAAPGTPEAEELSALVDDICDYEDVHFGHVSFEDEAEDGEDE